MRQQIIITVSSAAILIVTAGAKLIYFPEITAHTAFYFQSVFWICGLLMTIFSLNILWHVIVTRRSPSQVHRPRAFWPNRRKTFRIIYPAFIRPKMIIEKVDGLERRHLEFAIVDLSQEGSCFIDDGSLGRMTSFSGRIRFHNGDAIAISGEFVRTIGEHISVRFSHSISWPILLEEQRRVLAHMKPAPRRFA